MISILFTVAGLLYSISASLPFLVKPKTQIVIAVFIGIFTSICWSLISRNIPEDKIPIYGLYYDLLLTSVFIFVPYLFIPFNLKMIQLVGIFIIFIGLILVKIG